MLPKKKIGLKFLMLFFRFSRHIEEERLKYFIVLFSAFSKDDE